MVSILIVQVFAPKSEYEDDIVAELHDVIEEILDEDGKGEADHHNGGQELCGWR